MSDELFTGAAFQQIPGQMALDTDPVSERENCVEAPMCGECPACRDAIAAERLELWHEHWADVL